MKNSKANVPATQNEGWGFYGTMGVYASQAWPIAVVAIAEATGQEYKSVQKFLDSRGGRHFADSVIGKMHYGDSLKSAIDIEVKALMNMKVSPIVKKHFGLSKDLSKKPYLTAMVLNAVAFN